jgi:hypothetical protein
MKNCLRKGQCSQFIPALSARKPLVGGVGGDSSGDEITTKDYETLDP